jgi:tetratricopeptide (TPR) repeat protein
MMSRAEDYMLTAEELRLKRKRRRLIITIALSLPLALVIVIVAARPVRDAIKSWQARRHANKAFALIVQEKWTKARDEAVAAYQLRPTEPEAVRAVARLLTRTRQPQAVEYWDQLAKLSPLSRDDLRDDAAVALMLGDLHRAGIAVKKLLAADPAPPDFLLDAQLAARSGNVDVARADCEKVIADARANNRDQLQASMLRLALNSGGQAEATIWQRIANIAKGRDAAALDALMLLAQRALSGGTRSVASSEIIKDKQDVVPASAASGGTGSVPSSDEPDVAASLRDGLSQTGVGGTGSIPSTIQNKDNTEVVPPLKDLSARIEAHPLSRATHKLVALDLLEHSDATQRNALIERAIAQFNNGNIGDVAALAQWLNGKGEHQRLIDIIPSDVALKSRDVFLQYLDALGALGRWSDIKQLLGSERFPLEPFVQQMYLARCSVQLGEKTAAENNWRRALEAASGDPAKLIHLGEFAEKNGRFDIADTAYTHAVAQVPKSRPAYQARLRVARAQRDTRKLHGVLNQMLNIWPDDIAVQNDEAYTRALLLPTRKQGAWSTEQGEKSADIAVPSSNEAIDIAAAEEIEKLAQGLVEREPRSLPHRTLLALARLRGGHRTRALEAYNIEVPEEIITPSAVAVRAAVLYANGRITEAKDLIKQLSTDQLVAEERALIAPLL